MHPILNSLHLIKNSLEQKNASREFIRVALKEELQNYCLDAIYNSSEFNHLVFIGGTCLRKLYGLNRLSEDLDFEDDKDIDLANLGNNLAAYFKNLKFEKVDYGLQENENMSRLIMRFQLLFDLGLSDLESEKLHIKIEASKTKKILNTIKTPFSHDNLSMIIKNYDLPTLMAGKINACLSRTWQKGATGVFIKGRDYYDLIWYMQKGVIPNLEKLKEDDTSQSVNEAFILLDEKVNQIKSNDLYVDLKSYFESENYIRTWCDNFQDFYNTLRKNYSE